MSQCKRFIEPLVVTIMFVFIGLTFVLGFHELMCLAEEYIGTSIPVVLVPLAIIVNVFWEFYNDR